MPLPIRPTARATPSVYPPLTTPCHALTVTRRYDPSVPPALIHPPGGMDAAGHIALVEHQLAQLGAAFALSVALGRLLVLPPIVCGYDKVTPRKQSLSPRLHRCVASSTDPQPLSAPLHMALTWSLLRSLLRHGLVLTTMGPSPGRPNGSCLFGIAHSIMCSSPTCLRRMSTLATSRAQLLRPLHPVSTSIGMHTPPPHPVPSSLGATWQVR